MNRKELDEYLLSFPNTWLDFPFGEDTSVYKVGNKETDEGKMFALVADRHNPLRVSLKCDPVLAEALREEYESILPGYHLSKKHWNTILMTGQVSDEDFKDLVALSYRLVTESN